MAETPSTKESKRKKFPDEAEMEKKEEEEEEEESEEKEGEGGEGNERKRDWFICILKRKQERRQDNQEEIFAFQLFQQEPSNPKPPNHHYP